MKKTRRGERCLDIMAPGDTSGDIAHSDSQTAWTPYGEVNGGKDLENV